MDNELFWNRLDELVSTSRIIIDRPRGTPHPRYPSFIYPYDYGYLEGTLASDGGGIDIWVGSLENRTVTAVICTVDLTKRDTEVKILLGCTPEEAIKILEVHNRSNSMAGLLFMRQ